MKRTINSKFKKALDKIPKDLLDKMIAATKRIQLDECAFEEYLEKQRLPKKH